MPECMLPIRAQYYEQFDADYSLEVPGEGFGGWKSAELEINPGRTALSTATTISPSLRRAK